MFTSATSRSWSGTRSSTASPGFTTAPSVNRRRFTTVPDFGGEDVPPGLHVGGGAQPLLGLGELAAHLAQLGRDLLHALVEHLLDLPLGLRDGGVRAVHLAGELLHGALQAGHRRAAPRAVPAGGRGPGPPGRGASPPPAGRARAGCGWRPSGPARRGSPPAAARCGRAAPGAGCSGWRCAPRTARAGRAPRPAPAGGGCSAARPGSRRARPACPSRRPGARPGPAAPSAGRAAPPRWCPTGCRPGASAPARPPPWRRRGPGSRGRCRPPGAARCGGCPRP